MIEWLGRLAPTVFTLILMWPFLYHKVVRDSFIEDIKARRHLQLLWFGNITMQLGCITKTSWLNWALVLGLPTMFIETKRLWDFQQEIKRKTKADQLAKDMLTAMDFTEMEGRLYYNDHDIESA